MFTFTKLKSGTVQKTTNSGIRSSDVGLLDVTLQSRDINHSSVILRWFPLWLARGLSFWLPVMAHGGFAALLPDGRSAAIPPQAPDPWPSAAGFIVAQPPPPSRRSRWFCSMRTVAVACCPRVARAAGGARTASRPAPAAALATGGGGMDDGRPAPAARHRHGGVRPRAPASHLYWIDFL